jgi:hypothetical protein
MPQGDQVSEDTALWLSLGGTAASWTLLVVGAKMGHNDETGGNNGGAGAALATAGVFGVVFAPSFGHWYAHKIGTRGLGLRLAGTGVLALALMIAIGCDGECTSAWPTEGGALLGAGLFVVGTLDDIASATSAARHYNHRFDGLAIAPLIRRDGGGIVLGARF